MSRSCTLPPMLDAEKFNGFSLLSLLILRSKFWIYTLFAFKINGRSKESFGISLRKLAIKTDILLAVSPL